jgi:hypothetical protein
MQNQIKDYSNEYVQDCNEVLGFIQDGYEITNDENIKYRPHFSQPLSNLKQRAKWQQANLTMIRLELVELHLRK